MENEIWVDIIGFDGLYQISNHGNVKSIRYRKTKAESILTPELTKKGYLRVSLGKNKRFTIHRLVCTHFISNPNGYEIINHIDGVKTNNVPANLEWCTQSHNAKHALFILGNTPNNTGNTGGKSKLSKPCIQVLNGITINTFHGASDASRITNINKSSIIQVCNGNRTMAGGYKWRYT